MHTENNKYIASYKTDLLLLLLAKPSIHAGNIGVRFALFFFHMSEDTENNKSVTICIKLIYSYYSSQSQVVLMQAILKFVSLHFHMLEYTGNNKSVTLCINLIYFHFSFQSIVLKPAYFCDALSSQCLHWCNISQ